MKLEYGAPPRFEKKVKIYQTTTPCDDGHDKVFSDDTVCYATYPASYEQKW